MTEPDVAEQFEDLEKQAHAARLGMWVFLASEVLLFAGLFALYAAYRAEHPAGFAQGVSENTRVLGSINTAILLTSSFVVTAAVAKLRGGSSTRTVALLLYLAMALGVVFLAIKGVEYALHFGEGVFPGHIEHASAVERTGVTPFWTLYFVTTGLHAVHLGVAIVVLAFMTRWLAEGRISTARVHPLELSASYWHLVDLVWIFVWPLFYLARGPS